MLCRAKRNIDTTKFDRRFAFHEPQQFKGVVNGERYPVISLITSRNPLSDKLKNLEGKLLDRPREENLGDLFSYLDTYINYHNIERPELKLTCQSAVVPPPDHYQKYMGIWREDLARIQSDRLLEESAANEDIGSVEQEPISKPANQASWSEIVDKFSKHYAEQLNAQKLKADLLKEQSVLKNSGKTES
jgi:hypothetical protein